MQRRTTKSPTANRGTTMLEVMVVMAILIVAVSIFSQIVTTTAKVRSVSRERTLAAEAARKMLECMRNEDLHSVFDTHNASPEDDPGGPGTAPGHRFAVLGLRPLESAADGMVGEIIFPAIYQRMEASMREGESTETMESTGTTTTTSTLVVEDLWMLREDVEMPELGMPRDLNGDSVIDTNDHRYDALVLPVLIRVRWNGRYGERSLELATLLTDFDLAEK